MKIRFNYFAFATCFTVVLAYGARLPCFGQGAVYRDRSEFEAAIAGINGTRTDVNFQPPLPPGGTPEGPDIVRYDLPLTMPGLTFHSSAPLLIRETPLDAWWLNNFDSLTPLGVVMNGPTMAFGADFASLLSPVYTSFLATVTLNDGRVFTFTAPANPNFTFFGYVTTQAFSTLTFSDGGLIGPFHEEILDNITVVQVPEPGVWALLALGALPLGWRFRRVRHR
jgi:hypothetical protein